MYCLISPIIIRKNDAISDSLKDLISNYRGFFGCNYFTEKPSDLSLLLDLKAESDYLIKVISIDNLEKSNSSSDIGFHLIGYDVGLIQDENEFVFYSLIPNELSSKGYAYLTPFLSMLNQYKLFDNAKRALSMIERRQYLLGIGETSGIETFYDDCSVLKIYAIYLYDTVIPPISVFHKPSNIQ